MASATISRPIAAGLNSFGIKLLEEEAATHAGENVFLSPLSLYLALGMLQNGAEAKTLRDMRRTLGVPDDVNEGAFHDGVSELSRTLRARTGVELDIANALWSDKQIPFATEFVRKCRELYEADAFSVLLSEAEAAADAINAWVERNTRGKIAQIVDADTVRASIGILTNAIYFKGDWRTPFRKDYTEEAPFHLANGGIKQVKLMSQWGLEKAYRAGRGFEAAELPYGDSGMAFYAILPAAGLTPEQAMKNVSVEQLIDAGDQVRLDLKLPRFQLDYATRLRKPLVKMGMALAFSYPGAEFAPIGSPLFYVGQVIHKTRLEVDEQGTVAAAATAIVGIPGSAPPKRVETKVLVFDRPFGVLLCDTGTGTILFAGVVYDPR